MMNGELASGWLAGRVTSWDGQPLPDARVFTWSYGKSSVEVRSDEHGRFRLGPMPVVASGRFWCEAPGFARLRVGDEDQPGVAVFPGTTHDLGDIKLAPEMVVVGRVLSPDGDPLADARIVATSYYHQLAGTIAQNGPSTEARSGRDGSLRLTGLSPGRVMIEVGAPGLARIRTGASIVCTDTSIDLGSLRLTNARTPLAGIVTDRDGRPLSGARVTANDDNDESATTDEAGRFNLLARTDCIQYASVTYPGFGSRVTVRVTDPQNVDITVEPPRFVEGWVRDAETEQAIAIEDLSICEVRRRELDGTEQFVG